MAENESFPTLVKKVCQAALRGDSLQIARHLKCNRKISSSIDGTLLTTTNTALELLDRLSSDDPLPGCNADHALRALLLLPPCYETPWRAVVKLIECLHNQSGWLGTSPNALFAGTADVQTFLQQTISSWWRQENEGDSGSHGGASPRQWLERIAELALKPLVDADAAVVSARDNRHWVLPLDIVATIVCFCQELEGVRSPTSCVILDQLFSDSIVRSRMLPLLSLAHDLQSQLRGCDWERLLFLLRESLSNKDIPPADLPGVARSIISFSDQKNEWKLLVLHLLHAASTDMTNYSTVEMVMQSSLSSQSTQGLYEWQTVDSSSEESIPKWILANYYLLVFQAGRQSGSQIVSSLLSQALEKSNRSHDILDLCSQSLVHLCFPSARQFRRNFSIAQVQRLMNGVRYTGGGTFLRGAEPIQEWELHTICQSLYLGSTSLQHRAQRLSATDRAQAWIHAASSLLAKPLFASKVAAVLIIVAVFCEIPASRATLVRTIVADGEFDVVKCVIVGLLTRSLSDPRDLESLDPICSLLSSKTLPLEGLKQLSDAFAVFPSGRTATLSVCQKNLHSSTAPWWGAVASQGAIDRMESLEAALYGLCALLVKWDDVGWEAWKLLSDFLVMNKPALPVVMRSRVYQLILSFALQDRFPASTLARLTRALLVRLLSFVDSDNGKVSLAPHRAIASFVGSKEAIATEDLSMLIIAVTELTLKVAHGEADDQVVVEESRKKLESICLNPTQTTVEVGTTVDALFYYRTLSCLLASSVLSLSDSEIPKLVQQFSPSLEPDLRTVVELLRTAERTSYVEAERSAPPNLPGWLSSGATARTFGRDTAKVQAVNLTIVDQTIRFLGVSSSDLDTGAKLRLALTLSKLYDVRETIRYLISDQEDSTEASTVFKWRTPPVAPVSFFAEVVPLMLKKDDTQLEDLALTLKALVRSCEDVSMSCRGLSGDRDQAHDVFSLLGAVTKLYLYVGSEQPTLKLLQYLENECAERDPNLPDTDGILGIRCAEDADACVRGFRMKLLVTMVDCLGEVSRSKVVEAIAADGSFLQAFSTLKIEGKNPSLFFGEILEAMTTDVLEGLNGLSGGVSDALFSLYLDIIENVVSVSRDLASSMREGFSILKVTNAASERMKDILCQFQIDSPPLLKRTLHVAVVLLPSLQRTLLSSAISTTKGADYPSLVFFEALTKQVLTETLSTSPHEILLWSPPPEKTEAPKGTQGDSDNDSEINDDGEVPMEISIPHGVEGYAAHGAANATTLTSEAAWCHALNALLSGTDVVLSRSLLTMQQQSAERQDVDLKALKCYMKWQQESLELCAGVVCRCLKQLENASDTTNDQEVYAQFLPSPSKKRLLVVLEKAILLFGRACRLLALYVEKGQVPSCCLAEVVSIVCAWDGNSDVILGASRWFHAERTLNAKANRTEQETEKILSKGQRVLSRVDELSVVLQKLARGVASWQKKQESLQSARLCQVEQVMKRILGGKRDAFSLASTVGSHLDSIRASLEIGYDNDVPEQSSKRKRQLQQDIAKRMRRERNRPVPRSRNKVVDQWQYMDAELQDEDDEDAFVELEDFLVDG